MYRSATCGSPFVGLHHNWHPAQNSSGSIVRSSGLYSPGTDTLLRSGPVPHKLEQNYRSGGKGG